jgi:hypothetical protein
MLTRGQTINGPLCPKKPWDQITISGIVDSAFRFAVEEHSTFTSLLNGLPITLAILEHRNITRTLPKSQHPRGLKKAGNLLKTKAAIPKNGGLYTNPVTQVEMLWITPRWPQGDIVQVDHARLSSSIGLKHKN